MSPTEAAFVARVRDSLPVHYFDCDRFEVYNYGLRQGTCDCTATADVEALLTQAEANLTADNETGPATAQTADKDPSNKAEEGKQ